MKAAVLTEHNSPLTIAEMPVPAPQAGQVLVKVAYSGICHTQLLEIEGTNASGSHIPNLMGHEGSGVVEAVGPEVAKVKPGDHVILSWIKGSGANVLPTPYEWDGNRVNAGFVTTFNEYTLAAENRVTPIRKDMPLKPAALVGCAVATGMGIVFNNAKVQTGEKILVIGAGGIGLNAIHAAAIAGAQQIIVVDIDDNKLTRAKVLGATHTLNGKEGDIETFVNQVTKNKGVDYAIEAVGHASTMEAAYNSTDKFKGKCILCGVPRPGLRITIDPFPLYFGRSIVGTNGGETNPDEDYPKYCDWYMEGKIKLDEMISDVIPFAQVNEGIKKMQQGNCQRIVIEFD